MSIAIVLLVLAIGSRLASLWIPELSNFSPIMALAFCGAVYFRRATWRAVPFVALIVSDLYLNYYYAAHFGYTWTAGEMTIRALCFALGIGLGLLVARRKSWATLFAGSLGGSVLFYAVTNTASWWTDVYYAKTAAGWWQALTIGHPEFPPTWFFFRNTFLSDMLFTAAFVIAMEYAALRSGAASLFQKVSAREASAVH